MQTNINWFLPYGTDTWDHIDTEIRHMVAMVPREIEK